MKRIILYVFVPACIIALALSYWYPEFFLERSDPVPYARELVSQERYYEADEYLSYFMEFPYVAENDEAQELLKEIRSKRESWLYQIKKSVSGFFFGDSDEDIGRKAEFLSDFFVLGDIRDLAKEGNNYIQDKEVDKVTVALSSVGVVATGVTFFTAGAAVASKATISTLKAMNKSKLIPHWLVKQLLEDPRAAQQSLSSISELHDKSGFVSTAATLKNSKNFEHFNKLKKFSEAFGTKTAVLLKIADNDAILAFDKYGKTARNDILSASTYGKDGVRFLIKKGPQKFRSFNTDYAAKHGNKVSFQNVATSQKAFNGQTIKRIRFSDMKEMDQLENIAGLLDLASKGRALNKAQKIKYIKAYSQLDNGDAILLACLKKPGCNLDSTAQMMLGKSELHQMVFIRTVPENIQQLNKSVGTIGEELMHASYKQSGWTRLTSEINGRGIDGLYIKRNKQGSVIDVLIADSKYGSSPLGNTASGKQMSHDWIAERVGTLKKEFPNSTDYAQIEKHVLNNNYRAQVVKVSVEENKMIFNTTNIISKDGAVSETLVKGNQKTLQTFNHNRVIDLDNPTNSYHSALVTQLADSLKKIDVVGVN